MPVRVKFKCSGCFTETEFFSIKKIFTSFSGRDHGFGTYRTESIEEKAPDGWVAYDPHTQCTYCPDCWKEIMKDYNDK